MRFLHGALFYAGLFRAENQGLYFFRFSVIMLWYLGMLIRSVIAAYKMEEIYE